MRKIDYNARNFNKPFWFKFLIEYFGVKFKDIWEMIYLMSGTGWNTIQVYDSTLVPFFFG